MTPRAVVSSVDEPPGRSDLGGRRTPQLQVRTTAVPAEAGRGRRSESPQLKPTILTLPRPCDPAWDAKLAQNPEVSPPVNEILLCALAQTVMDKMRVRIVAAPADCAAT